MNRIERLTKLFFELASPERMNIILQLKKSEMKLSKMARVLDLTVTETSRHLQRLNEAGLIQKNPDNLFSLTQFGELTLLMTKNLGFISKYYDFFHEYDLAGIPIEFVERLGDLSKGVYSKETFKNLEEGEKKIREAQEFVWILSDDVLSNAIPILMEKLKGTFDLRIILLEGKFPPEKQSRLPLGTPGVQKRVLPKINILIVLTEKYACFCLPNKNGKIDYKGFVGDDKNFHNWCKEVFLYYWDKSNTIS